MLEVLVNFFCATIMTLTGYYVINQVSSKEKKKKVLKSLVLSLILIIISIILHPIQYTGLYTITIFLVNIGIYKFIFNISLEESVIGCGILMMILFLADMISSTILINIFTMKEIRTNYIILIVANLAVSSLTIGIINIRPVFNQIKKFYDNIVPHKKISNTIFFMLLVIDLSFLTYSMASENIFNRDYIINLIIIIILIIITYIFVQNRNNYKKLADEYDSLFSYVQNFEEWIEKEQLNRHEYKNQLAVLRCLTKEKKVKSKIDEILEDNINIEGAVVNQLKGLPKGGIKGLMYYKSAIAQKSKINLTVDVSLERKSLLNKLSEKDVRKLCKLIGIYFDNAIEAAKETRKKKLLIEIYEFQDKINIVFSNTFKKNKIPNNRNKKGVSSKGNGRGNGLYFASKLIEESTWLKQRQEIIDNYYIQELTIKKRNAK